MLLKAELRGLSVNVRAACRDKRNAPSPMTQPLLKCVGVYSLLDDCFFVVLKVSLPGLFDASIT